MNEQNKTEEVVFDKLIRDDGEKIVALLTVIPSRRDVVLHTIDSIYDQVDELRIIFNGFDHLPSWAVRSPKIKARVDRGNSLSDCAKWLHVPDKGYVLSIDDDILYPEDYVSTMIAKIEQYERKAVVTVHGSYFTVPYISYGKSKRSFRFMMGLNKDVRVPMIGTGTLAFHIDTIPAFLFVEAVKNLLPNRSDIWFSRFCLENNIPMMCIERMKYWLKPLRTDGDTIWNKMCNDEEFLNENTILVNKCLLPHIKTNLMIGAAVEERYVIFNR